MTRREAREQAFCLLFEFACTNEAMDHIVGGAAEARDLVLDPFAEELAFGAEEHLEEIDRVVSANSKGWSLRRLSRVALTVLRLAIYELLFDSAIPASVSVNEAVLLAQKYGGQGDAPYINGVLGTVVKSLPDKDGDEKS